MLFDAHSEPQGALLLTLMVLAPGEAEPVHKVEGERARALAVQRRAGAPEPLVGLRSDAFEAAPSDVQAAVVYLHATVVEGRELLPGDEANFIQVSVAHQSRTPPRSGFASESHPNLARVSLTRSHDRRDATNDGHRARECPHLTPPPPRAPPPSPVRVPARKARRLCPHFVWER